MIAGETPAAGVIQDVIDFSAITALVTVVRVTKEAVIGWDGLHDGDEASATIVDIVVFALTCCAASNNFCANG